MPTHSLNLTDQDASVIIEALGELPLKISGPVFSRLSAQLSSPQTEIMSIKEKLKADEAAGVVAEMPNE